MKPLSERNPIVVAIVGLALMGLLAFAVFDSANLPIIGGGTGYTAYFAEAAGLQAGNEVRVAGVTVGRVTGISLAGNKVAVNFKVKGTWVGTMGGVARLDKDGRWNTYTRANTNGGNPVLSGDAHDRLDRWFDTSVFSQPAPYPLGNLSPLVTNPLRDTHTLPPQFRTDAEGTDYEKYLQKNFPEPQLEIDERTELNKVRLYEEDRLSTYDYIDKDAGTVLIPIDRAMDLLVQRGLPTRTASTESAAASAKATTKGNQ